MSNVELDEFGAKPLRVSWSRMHEWELCQQRALFHMDKKGDTVKDGRRFVHGTLADRAMRKWLEQPEGSHKPGEMDAYVDELWESIVDNSEEYKIDWKGDPAEDKARVRDIAKRVVNNVEPFLFARVLPYDFHPELRFSVPVQVPDSNGFARTIILNGGMDIAVRRPDGTVYLYDLKATTNERYIQSGIMPQLIFYGIAWSLMHGTRGEDITAAFLTPACETQYHELNVSAQDRTHLMTRIVKFANSIWDETPPACTSDKNECFFCDCKKICPLWADVLAEPKADGKKRVSLADMATQRQAAKENSHDKHIKA